MKGWKTWAGAVIIAGSAVLKYFGYSDLAEALLMIGTAFGIIGLGHKIEKAKQQINMSDLDSKINRIKVLLEIESNRQEKDKAGIYIPTNMDAMIRKKALEDCLKILED